MSNFQQSVAMQGQANMLKNSNADSLKPVFEWEKSLLESDKRCLRSGTTVRISHCIPIVLEGGLIAFRYTRKHVAYAPNLEPHGHEQKGLQNQPLNPAVHPGCPVQWQCDPDLVLSVTYTPSPNSEHALGRLEPSQAHS